MDRSTLLLIVSRLRTDFLAACTLVASQDWASPSVIGLMSFSMTTILTGLNIAGYFPGGAALALAFIWGGVAQFVAGWVALKQGNIFTGTVFVGYGSFWISLFLIENASIGLAPQSDMLGFWLVWTLFTFAFAVNAPKHGPGITVAFVLLLIGIALLDAVSAGMSSIEKVAGWEVFVTGLVAWYLALAAVTNENYGRKILPS